MSLYDLVAARAGYRCEYCHAPEVLFNHRFPVDHIIPAFLTAVTTLIILLSPAIPATAANIKKRNIRSPKPVSDIYRLWRSTPLIRAHQLEKALDTPAHIYYKNVSAEPCEVVDHVDNGILKRPIC